MPSFFSRIYPEGHNKPKQPQKIAITINYHLINESLSYSCVFSKGGHHRNTLPYHRDLNFSQIILDLIRTHYPDTAHLLISIKGEGVLNEKDKAIKITSFDQRYYASIQTAATILNENLDEELQNYLSGKDEYDSDDEEINIQMNQI